MYFFYRSPGRVNAFRPQDTRRLCRAYNNNNNIIFIIHRIRVRASILYCTRLSDPFGWRCDKLVAIKRALYMIINTNLSLFRPKDFKSTRDELMVTRRRAAPT